MTLMLFILQNQEITLNSYQKQSLAFIALGFIAGFLCNEIWDGVVAGDYKKALGCLIGMIGLLFLAWFVVLGQIIFFS